MTSDSRFKKAITFYGTSKLLMGTDTPYGAKDNLQKNIDRIQKLEIVEDEKKLMFGLKMINYIQFVKNIEIEPLYRMVGADKL